MQLLEICYLEIDQNWNVFSSAFSVEDHFAKALGDTWLKLKAKEKAEQQQQKKKPQVAAVVWERDSSPNILNLHPLQNLNLS